MLDGVWIAAITSVLALVIVSLAGWSEPSATWTVDGLQVIPEAMRGEPLVGFVAAHCAGCDQPRLQARVCPTDGGACDPAARLIPAESGVTRLRYSRSLPPGSYLFEVLFLDEDRWGVVRTLAVVGRVVDVR